MKADPSHPYTTCPGFISGLASRTSRSANQNLPKSLAALPHGQTADTKHRHTTHGIVHEGFRGIRVFVARKKGRCKLIGNRFVIPHDTIPSTVGRNLKNTMIYGK